MRGGQVFNAQRAANERDEAHQKHRQRRIIAERGARVELRAVVQKIFAPDHEVVDIHAVAAHAHGEIQPHGQRRQQGRAQQKRGGGFSQLAAARLYATRLREQGEPRQQDAKGNQHQRFGDALRLGGGRRRFVRACLIRLERGQRHGHRAVAQTARLHGYIPEPRLAHAVAAVAAQTQRDVHRRLLVSSRAVQRQRYPFAVRVVDGVGIGVGVQNGQVRAAQRENAAVRFAERGAVLRPHAAGEHVFRVRLHRHGLHPARVVVVKVQDGERRRAVLQRLHAEL